MWLNLMQADLLKIPQIVTYPLSDVVFELLLYWPNWPGRDRNGRCCPFTSPHNSTPINPVQYNNHIDYLTWPEEAFQIVLILKLFRSIGVETIFKGFRHSFCLVTRRLMFTIKCQFILEQTDFFFFSFLLRFSLGSSEHFRALLLMSGAVLFSSHARVDYFTLLSDPHFFCRQYLFIYLSLNSWNWDLFTF